MTVAERAQALAAELRPGIEPDPDPRAVMPGDDTTEQDRAVRVAGERQRFTALDKTLAGDPSAAPDQRAFLVVTPPYETGLRGNGIQPFAAHEAGEYRIALPARCAHPHDLAPGADDGSALPISEQRIVTKGMRGHRLKVSLRAAAHAARLPASVRASRLPGTRRLMRQQTAPVPASRRPVSRTSRGAPPRSCGHRPYLWVPGQCSAASPRAASSARPATSQVT